MSMNAWEARGRIRSVKPNCPPAQALDFINRRVRNILDTRTWSDCMKIGMIVIPAATTTGVVTMTPGSNLVTGVATSWPVNDRINAVITQPITDSPGFMEIFPTSGVITKIQPGMLLLLEQENASVTEILTVQSVGPTSFMAYCQYAHAMNATLQQSSLAGQQFATDAYVYTVQAVLSTTSLQLDMYYGGLPETGVSYMIRQEYVQISSTAKYAKAAYDAIAGQTIGVDREETWLMMQDPQDQSTGNPLELARMHAAPGGVMQWRLWPYQTSPYAIAVLYQDGWPTLSFDTDMLPPFLNSEVVVAGATADALRTRVIRNERDKDPYYSPQDAQFWETEYARLLEAATQSDEGRRLVGLTNYHEQLINASYNWMRSHAVSASGAGWGVGL